MENRELNAEQLLAKNAARDEFDRRTNILLQKVKDRGAPKTEQEAFEFMCDMRMLYDDTFAFLNDTAAGVIPEAQRHELIAEGHRLRAELERDYANKGQLPTKLRYWQYPHLWPVLALIVGLIVIAAKFGGAS